jgi:hypothetical protein
MHESLPDTISFGLDNPKFLEIVVECLRMHRAISHMGTNTISLVWHVASWPHAPRLNATMSLEILYFHPL